VGGEAAQGGPCVGCVEVFVAEEDGEDGELDECEFVEAVIC